MRRVSTVAGALFYSRACAAPAWRAASSRGRARRPIGSQRRAVEPRAPRGGVYARRRPRRVSAFHALVLSRRRKTDKVILASRTHTADKSYDFVANVAKVLGSPGWASVTTDKLSLDDGPNMFYVLIDEVRGVAARRGVSRRVADEARPAGACRGPPLGNRALLARRNAPRSLPARLRLQSGRVFIAITSKAYPSRYIYGSTDGSRGVLAGASGRAHSFRAHARPCLLSRWC